MFIRFQVELLIAGVFGEIKRSPSSEPFPDQPFSDPQGCVALVHLYIERFKGIFTSYDSDMVSSFYKPGGLFQEIQLSEWDYQALIDKDKFLGTRPVSAPVSSSFSGQLLTLPPKESVQPRQSTRINALLSRDSLGKTKQVSFSETGGGFHCLLDIANKLGMRSPDGKVVMCSRKRCGVEKHKSQKEMPYSEVLNVLNNIRWDEDRIARYRELIVRNKSKFGG